MCRGEKVVFYDFKGVERLTLAGKKAVFAGRGRADHQRSDRGRRSKQQGQDRLEHRVQGWVKSRSGCLTY